MRNNDNPKIAFAYPTFIRPGMLASGPFAPDIGWTISDFPGKLSFYVSAGLILNSNRAYSFDVDVLFDGKSLIPEKAPAVDSKLLGTTVSDRDDFIALSTTFLSNITIPSEGLYTVRVLLHTGHVESDNRLLIDSHDCHFVIAKNWLANVMEKVE
ncbi:hypothetical protein E4A63_21515 [Salmonella enterica subsp. enterica serovar Ank]|nr:hypothetical protein [Salmonella enterica subsp. enterica serovar Ank]